ncbi:MAG: membrane dipeptidase [Chitinophagaceae bacterium]|nr:MAG: membrane dipeptidase [Chitinophagaceae bacterium]
MLCLSTLFFSSAQSQSASRVHKKAVLVDTHNDILSSAVLDGKDISVRIPEGHSDLVRFSEGGVDVQFFSVFTGPDPRNKEGVYKDANQEIDSLQSIVARNMGRMILAKNYKTVRKGIRQKKLVALIGVEGGHMIEGDIKKLQALYDRGMRYMTLTWNNSTPWASSAMDETLNPGKLGKKGLNDFGREVVRKMNELGVIVDLSHTGEQTFYDAIATTTKPVLLTHSSVWNICPVFRNVKDEQIKAVAKNGGVICVNFYSGFISKVFDERLKELNGPSSQPIKDSLLAIAKDSAMMQTQWQAYLKSEMEKVRPTISQLVDHIDYIVKLVGDEYAGIGADYDGVGSLPIGMDDVTTYPKITEELTRRGYKKASIKRILGGNVMRVMRANFK